LFTNIGLTRVAKANTLITRIVLVANGPLAGERALAAMAAGAARRAHGFEPTLLPKIESENNRLTELFNSVAMDPANGEQALPGAPTDSGRRINAGEDPEPYSFLFRFINGRGEPGTARVELKVVGSSPITARRDRELTAWLSKPPDVKDAVVRTGLWVVAGQEAAFGSSASDRSKRPVFLQHELMVLAENMLDAVRSNLQTVVLSVSGFEYYLLDAYQRFAQGSPNPAGDWRRPLQLACDPRVVREIMLALTRQAPLFRQVVSRCSAWQRSPSAANGRLALLQPISANGFFSDDGSPNVDRAKGSPLLTQDGMIDDRSTASASPFPQTDRELQAWLPYLTADPVMEIILRRAGRLAVECGDLEMDLPKQGRPRNAAMV
jgi:hypothetical protein